MPSNNEHMKTTSARKSSGWSGLPAHNNSMSCRALSLAAAYVSRVCWMSIARLMFCRASSSNGIHMWRWPPAFLKHGLAASTLCATRGPMGRQRMDRLDLGATMLFDVQLQNVTIYWHQKPGHQKNRLLYICTHRGLNDDSMFRFACRCPIPIPLHLPLPLPLQQWRRMSRSAMRHAREPTGRG